MNHLELVVHFWFSYKISLSDILGSAETNFDKEW